MLKDRKKRVHDSVRKHGISGRNQGEAELAEARATVSAGWTGLDGLGRTVCQTVHETNVRVRPTPCLALPSPCL